MQDKKCHQFLLKMAPVCEVIDRCMNEKLSLSNTKYYRILNIEVMNS